MTTSTITEEETSTAMGRLRPGGYWGPDPVTSDLTWQATHICFDDAPSQHRMTSGRCPHIRRHW
jgi:hypothetical protein